MAKKNGNGKSKGPQVVDFPVDEDGFETIGGNTQEMAVGETVIGTYGGVVRTMPGEKKGSIVQFHQVGDRTILGGAVFESRLKDGKVKVGDTLKVTRLEDGKKKPGRNPPKMYAMGVKRSKIGSARA